MQHVVGDFDASYTALLHRPPRGWRILPKDAYVSHPGKWHFAHNESMQSMSMGLILSRHRPQRRFSGRQYRLCQDFEDVSQTPIDAIGNQGTWPQADKAGPFPVESNRPD